MTTESTAADFMSTSEIQKVRYVHEIMMATSTIISLYTLRSVRQHAWPIM